LEDQLLRDARNSLTAVTTADVALYILNNKRAFVTDMESRYGITISVQASDRMQGANFAIERAAARPAPQRQPDRSGNVVNMEWGFEGQESEEEAAEEAAAPASEPAERESGRRGRRRRRRGRREDRAEDRHEHRERQAGNGEQAETASDDAAYATDPHGAEDLDEPAGLGEQPSVGRDEDGREERRGRRRRRGRRGGRRGRDRDGAPREGGDDLAVEGGTGLNGAEPGAAHVHADGDADQAAHDAPARPAEAAPEERSDRWQEPRYAAPAERAEPVTRAPEQPSQERGSRAEDVSRTAGRAEEPAAPTPASSPAPEREREPVHAAEYAPEPPRDEPQQPARKGWWQRRFSGE
jgi:ribonuclease E